MRGLISLCVLILALHCTGVLGESIWEAPHNHPSHLGLIAPQYQVSSCTISPQHDNSSSGVQIAVSYVHDPTATGPTLKASMRGGGELPIIDPQLDGNVYFYPRVRNPRLFSNPSAQSE